MAAISRQDLLIILRFGAHVARVDREFAPLERNLLKRMSDAIHLTEQEKKELANGEASLASGLQGLSCHDAKNLLVKTLCAVAHSDGKATPEELEFIEKVISKFSDSVFVYPREEWGKYEDEVLGILNGLK
jgi:tellurite resistance protein